MKLVAKCSSFVSLSYQIHVSVYSYSFKDPVIFVENVVNFLTV